jgi:hypothetical protein
MDLDIRWVRLDDGKNCLSVTVQGSFVVDDFKETLRRIAGMQGMLDIAVLLDLRSGRWDFSEADIKAIAAGFSAAALRMDGKIALLCLRDIDQFAQVVVISSAATNRGFRTRAFYDSDVAMKWLGDEWVDC